jgi:hypothetical protein
MLRAIGNFSTTQKAFFVAAAVVDGFIMVGLARIIAG